MIVDLTQKFIKQIEVGKESKQNVPIKISIQASLCYKQAADLYASLKKIETIMVENKQNYFSNAAYSFQAFTDQQRNEFDEEIKNSLSIGNLKISQFKDVIDNLKAESTTQKEHMKNIAVCLYQFFKNVSALFRQFLEFNQNRKRKLQSAISLEVKSEFKLHSENIRSSPQQKVLRKPSQMDEELERQSKMIFMEKVSDHKKLEDTKKTLEKINEVLDKMENKVLQQEILTSSFKQIGEVGLFHIEKGNKNLIQANKISKDTGKYWTYYFLSLALSLLFLDFLKS